MTGLEAVLLVLAVQACAVMGALLGRIVGGGRDDR